MAGRLWQIMGLAVIISAAFTTGGLALSYGPDLPAGAFIIVLAALWGWLRNRGRA